MIPPREFSSELTSRARYHSLVALSFRDISKINGAPWQKSADLQSSPKMDYDKGELVNFEINAVAWAELLAIVEKYRRMTEYFRPSEGGELNIEYFF